MNMNDQLNLAKMSDAKCGYSLKDLSLMSSRMYILLQRITPDRRFDFSQIIIFEG